MGRIIRLEGVPCSSVVRMRSLAHAAQRILLGAENIRKSAPAAREEPGTSYLLTRALGTGTSEPGQGRCQPTATRGKIRNSLVPSILRSLSLSQCPNISNCNIPTPLPSENGYIPLLPAEGTLAVSKSPTRHLWAHLDCLFMQLGVGCKRAGDGCVHKGGKIAPLHSNHRGAAVLKLHPHKHV